MNVKISHVAKVVLPNIRNIHSLQNEQDFMKSKFYTVIVNVYVYDRYIFFNQLKINSINKLHTRYFY